LNGREGSAKGYSLHPSNAPTDTDEVGVGMARPGVDNRFRMGPPISRFGVVSDSCTGSLTAQARCRDPLGGYQRPRTPSHPPHAVVHTAADPLVANSPRHTPDPPRLSPAAV
jgi:hypothetical protein